MQTKFRITNLDCPACYKLSDGVLKELPGVTSVQIEENGLTTIESSGEIAWSIIKDALASVDKKAELI